MAYGRIAWFGIFATLGTQVSANSNAVGQAPLMGWSGYNAFMQNSGHCDRAGAGGYNETTFVQTMEALQRYGLDKLGYQYLNLDDCWIAENRTSDGKLTADKSRFPHGMTWLAEQAHMRGFKLGLYAAASKETCRQFPGSQGHEEVDAATLAGFGADFVKLDSCGGDLGGEGPESWMHQYTRWSKAMNESGRQMVFSCSWAFYYASCVNRHGSSVEACSVSPLAPATETHLNEAEQTIIQEACHMWRYDYDLAPTWSSVGGILGRLNATWTARFRNTTAVGAFNDPDFIVVGCPTDKPCESYSGAGKKNPPLSDLEQRTQFSMWSIMQAPLIIGSDIRTLSKTALETLSNKAVIAIDQDTTSLPFAVSVSTLSKQAVGVQAWARTLADGSVAVAMMNEDAAISAHVSVSVEKLGFGSAISVVAENVWTKEKIPIEPKGTVQASLKPHETYLFVVQKSSDLEKVLV